LICVIFNDHDP